MKIKQLILYFLISMFSLGVYAPLLVSADEVEIPVIIIDPGHGGIDGGTTAGIRTEKVYNLILAQYLSEELLQHGGFEVHLTREDNDTYLKYFPRAINIVEYDADLILSMHCNSSEYSYVNGVEAITSLIDRYAAYDLGNLILSKICNATGMKNRGVFTREDTGDSLGVYFWDSEKNWDMPGASHLKKVSDYFSINTWASKFGAPSLIIEHGYLSHSGDRETLDKDENLRRIAQAEAAALIEYYYGHTHTYSSEKVVDFPSNCTMNGTKSYRCTICGIKSETEQLPEAPDAHFLRQIGSMNSTCDKEGFIEYICQISHNLNSGGYGNTVHGHKEILPKKEHSYVTVTETQPKHGKDGARTVSCENCGNTAVIPIPGEAHTYEIVQETPPTCTRTGSKTHQCTVCGDVYSEEIPELGHQSIGTDTCSVCGLPMTGEPDTEPSETDEIPESTACPHQFEVKSHTDPTCEEDGVTVSVCTLCGAEEEKTEAKSGHYFSAEDGICMICGEKNEENTRKNPAGIFKNPLFLVIFLIVIAQAVAFLLISLLHRRKTHKSGRKSHNDIKRK